MERFGCNTRLVAGAGAAAELAALGARRLFVVTDPYFYQNGVAQQLAARSGAEKIAFFHEVRPDPTVELAARGTAALSEFGADWVLALGGGSAMDCAKAMVYFSGKSVRLAAMPTTSGSGSEMTDFAILTHNGVKHPLVDPKLRPEVAILDSDLLKELPPKLIAETGFDVLTHAAEAYVAKNAGAVTDALASDAFRTAFSCLPASYAGDTSVRLRLHIAASMAGMAFTQAGLGLCHAMAHALGGAFHVPHGSLNAILLPAVIEVNAHGSADRYAKLASAVGLGGSAHAVAVRSLKNALLGLRRQLNLPQTLAQAGIRPELVWRGSRDIVQAVLEDPCCETNPVTVEDFMVRRVLEAVTGRG